MLCNLLLTVLMINPRCLTGKPYFVVRKYNGESDKAIPTENQIRALEKEM